MQGEHGLHRGLRLRAWALQLGCMVRKLLLGCGIAFLLGSLPDPASGLTVPAGDLAPLNAADGELDAADFLILQRFILGTLTPTPEQILIGDVAPLGSPDGELNAGDLAVLMRAIHGEIGLAPVYLGPDPPVLYAADGPTNDNPYTLTGSAAPGLEVRLYLNGTLYDSAIAAEPDGAFAFQLVLQDGQHQIYTAVVEAGVEGPASDLLSVEYVNNVSREQGGVLAEDTVWTPGAVPEPYVITSTLTVAPGATLTLMPGAVLRFATGVAFEVDGTLTVAGDATAPVTFTSNAATPADGDWAGIRIRAGSQNSRLDGAIVEYARSGVSVEGSQVLISNCTVRSFARNGRNFGIGFANGAGGVVEDCVIESTRGGLINTYYGISITSGSQPVIRRNRIVNTYWAIFVEGASPWISGNDVNTNSVGIFLAEGAQALVNGGNVIRNNNSVGIQYDGGSSSEIPGSIVKYNSIYDNRLNAYMGSYERSDEFEIDLSENWWGTTSPSMISAGIYDHKDVWGVDTPPARVIPFLDGPNGQPVSGNFLNGRVTQDATIGPGTDPYIAIGSYVVAPDATLTILPGAHIKLASNTVLHARGSLVVQGSDQSPVVFSSSDDIGALPSGWGLLLGDLSSMGYTADASISGARFEGLYIATEAGSANAVIEENLYFNNHQAIRFTRGSNGTISDNEILGNKDYAAGGTRGIDISTSGDVDITKNTLSGMVTGIAVRWLGRPNVRENTVTGTIYGISLSASNPSDEIVPVINGGNTIAGNEYGIYSDRVRSGVVTINRNNIHGNVTNYYKTNSYNAGDQIVEDATNNWWNTIAESEVAAGIYAETPGTVDYVPFLIGPVPVAPIIEQEDLLTNSASHTISGAAQPGVQVRIVVNATEQLVVDASQDGRFFGTVILIEGRNSIHAEAFNSTTTSSPSNTVLVTLDTVPPDIDLTRPASGSVINAYPSFTGTVNEPSTLTVAGQSVVVATDNSFTYGPVSLSEGSNDIAVIATDLAGNVATQTVILTLDTTPPADPDMGLVTFGPLVDGAVTVTGAAGAIDAGAFVYVANARTGQIAVVSAGGNGAFSASIAAQPGDTLTLVATDGLGNQTAWTQEAVAGTPPEFAIIETDPPNGALVQGNRATITGRFQGGEGNGIVVAGHVADIQGDRFSASDIYLTEGVNNIDIVVTTPDGTVLTHALVLSSTGSVPFSVRAAPSTGTSPLLTTLTVFNDTGLPIQSLQYDLDYDGSYETSYSDLNYSEVWIGLAYYATGIHMGRVRVVDAGGSSYVLPFSVTVEESIGKQAQLRAQYQRMLTRLSAGNVQSALNLFADTSRQRYESVFNALASQLGVAVQTLGVIESVSFGDGWAELMLVRDSSAGMQAYRINMIRSEDGVWRIEDM